MKCESDQWNILQVSYQTTVTLSFTTFTGDFQGTTSNDTCCDVDVCHTDVIKELYKSNKNQPEKSKEDGSESICNYVDSQELVVVPYTDVANESVCHTYVSKELCKSNKNQSEKSKEDGPDSICNYVDSQELALVPYTDLHRGDDITHESNFDRNQAIDKNYLKDLKSIKRQHKKNSREFQIGSGIAHTSNFDTKQTICKNDLQDKTCMKRQHKKNGRVEFQIGSGIAHKSNFDTKQAIDKNYLKDKKSTKRQNRKNGRERATPIVELQSGDEKKDNQNLDRSQTKDITHLRDKYSSDQEYCRGNYPRKICRCAPALCDGKWFIFAFLITMLFSARVSCMDENAGMKLQFPSNPILFGTDAELSCYRPFAENIEKVGYFAWRNLLTADYLANGNRSMNESKYEPAMIYTESGINYTLRIKMFDHDDFNMLYGCNIGFLEGHVNLSACNTTFIYLPKNEDITSHNVRNDDQETMVIEMKRVHPKPVCKLYIKNKMISDNLYNATTVRSVLRYYSLRFEFSSDFLVHYCFRVLKILCSVSTEKIHHNQTINISSCIGNKTKSENTIAVIVTVTIFILILMAIFGTVLYLKRRQVGPFRKNSNGSVVKGRKHDKESAMGTYDLITIRGDENG